MFGIWRNRKPKVSEHWYVVLPDFSCSTSAFYLAVEAAIEAKQMPDFSTKRVSFSEGGLDTHRRQYLRFQRERFVFDICSAPFGTTWFFSCRKAVIPFRWRLIELLIAIAGVVASFLWFKEVFDDGWDIAFYAANIIGALVIVATLANLKKTTLDSILLQIPVFGSVYELFLRLNQTYYAEDSRLLYFEIVGEVVAEKVKEFAAAHGVEEVEFKINDDPESPQSRWDQFKAVVQNVPGFPVPWGRIG